MQLPKLLFLSAFLFFISIYNCCAQSNKVNTISSENIDVPKAMFLSDFHIGEVYGSVTKALPKNDSIKKYYDSTTVNNEKIYYRREVKKLFKTLHEKCKQNNRIPYLILMGDIVDMAVHNSSDAMNLAHSIFNDTTIFKGRSFTSYFDTIIYIPGNHDHHVWKMLQEQYYISNSMELTGIASPVQQQIIGVLDLEKGSMSKDSVIFPDPQKNFLSRILSDTKKPVYIAYPNLYIKTDSKHICVTHGHFFEPGWNNSSLNISKPGESINDSVYFSELEKNNSPLTEFSDYAIAQSMGGLAQGINDIQYGDSSYYQNYLELVELYPQLFPVKPNKVKRTKHNDIQKLLEHPELVDSFLVHTQGQMLDEDMIFNTLIYGHTHVPCDSVQYIKDINDLMGYTLKFNLSIYNTGGWVGIDDVSKPTPLFLYGNGNIESISLDLKEKK
jgi:predicted phosphodiesterase